MQAPRGPIYSIRFRRLVDQFYQALLLHIDSNDGAIGFFSRSRYEEPIDAANFVPFAPNIDCPTRPLYLLANVRKSGPAAQFKDSNSDLPFPAIIRAPPLLKH